ncbi:L-amino acid N-acyltransferase YncA [Antricoccus suffuscus]|uniref:L-amino acid N-acyltransferase YncA n=1 Tax=Antricoccus suffuscus TaxID=1629062 RepID=A0A2T1A482_9ACTN|nr:GNAT family N-acetyltransferase [Antricoccus suffuscus]PRZ43354.1 L-amino acid N-acyltransferase YncA [Antricoccus suffuscus]
MSHHDSAQLPHGTDPRVRQVADQDLDAIITLVRGLAIYEKAEHEALMTTEQLRAALFADDPAVFGLVASESPNDHVVGFALYFLNFSTWRGVHGIYLEDLFVEEAHRGTGLGKALLQTLAKIAEDRGYARVEWSVLKWNTPSIDFYRSIGAVAMTDWDTMRLTDQALTDFAADRGQLP